MLNIKFYTGIHMPLCFVSKSQYLSNNNGWLELKNSDSGVPFRLYKDESKIFLQWLGEPEVIRKTK